MPGAAPAAEMVSVIVEELIYIDAMLVFGTGIGDAVQFVVRR